MGHKNVTRCLRIFVWFSAIAATSRLYSSRFRCPCLSRTQIES